MLQLSIVLSAAVSLTQLSIYSHFFPPIPFFTIQGNIFLSQEGQGHPPPNLNFHHNVFQYWDHNPQKFPWTIRGTLFREGCLKSSSHTVLKSIADKKKLLLSQLSVF